MHSSLNNSLVLSRPSRQYGSIGNNSNKRSANLCGKIVKNSSRTKTEVSTEASKVEMGAWMGERRDGGRERYVLRSQASLSNYQSKLAAYESNKRSVLRDIGRLNTQEYIAEHKGNKAQHFLTTKLKQSLKQSWIQAGKQNNNEPSKLEMSIESSSVQIKKFITEIDQQVRLQSKLRKLKHQISITNRKQILELLQKFYSPYQHDIEEITKICYEEYQFSAEKKEGKENGVSLLAISADVLGQKLIQTYQMCESNWKNRLAKKFDCLAMKRLYEQLNFQNKMELDLKCFTRELNLYFCRGYQPRELFRIFARIAPLNKSSFIFNFSAPKL